MKKQNFLEKYPKRYNAILFLTSLICVGPYYLAMKIFNYFFIPNAESVFEKVIDMAGTTLAVLFLAYTVGRYIGVPLFDFLLKNYIAFLERK